MKKILPLLALICLNCSNPIKNGDTDSFLVEIPYEYINQKIIIPVEINNKEYRFCFDTGSRTVIRSKIKSEILPTVQSEVGDWFITDGNIQSHLMSSILIDSLSIGEIHFKNVEALTDTIHHEVWQCFDFDGYIGSELLQEYIVQIDPTDNKIRFAKDIHALSLNNKEAQEMVLIGNQGSPYIWLQFDKTEKPFKDFVLVDTGMHGIYNLSLDTYERLLKNKRIDLLAKSKGASTISAFGLGEIKEQFLFHFPSFSIGNFTINNEEIALVELKSKVLVVVMIYTSCKAACPRLVADMQNIESQIDPKVKKNLKMVFVSIDPTTDTPEHLKAFAIANKMDHDPWLFLRGSESNTREFAAVLAVKYKKITPLDFSHSNIISVFNPEGVLVHQQEGLGVNNQETIAKIKEQLGKLP